MTAINRAMIKQLNSNFIVKGCASKHKCATCLFPRNVESDSAILHVNKNKWTAKCLNCQLVINCNYHRLKQHSKMFNCYDVTLGSITVLMLIDGDNSCNNECKFILSGST